jgi:uncharacterized damage-inducible protein DinB
MTPEFAVTFRDMMCDEIAREAETTRRVLDAAAVGDPGYRPDDKSATAADRVRHTATTTVWFLNSIADLRFATRDESAAPASLAEMGAWYAAGVAAGLERVRAMPAERLLTPTDFLGLFNFPAVSYLGFTSKHEIHHRGQLSAYLRPMGSKVPRIYGGSADEPLDFETYKAAAQ